jgi:hypothetical protein
MTNVRMAREPSCEPQIIVAVGSLVNDPHAPGQTVSHPVAMVEC